MNPCPGEVMTYEEMCRHEGRDMESEMNYRLSYDHSVLLMSLTPEASRSHRVEEDGVTIIYEGHNAAGRQSSPITRYMDQPMHFHAGGLTQNGLFYKAALDFRNGVNTPEMVRIYEELKSGVWIYSGLFRLADAWQEPGIDRLVFRFRLELEREQAGNCSVTHWQVFPQSLRLEAWKRDGGRCGKCGGTDGLRFSVAEGAGSERALSLEDIRLLCGMHAEGLPGD